MTDRDWRRLSSRDAFTLTCLAYAVVWGAVTIAGERGRWSGPVFAVARDFAGGPTSWGTALIAFAALGVLGVVRDDRMLAQAGLVMCLLWSVAFAACLGAAAVRDPNATWTGVVTWGFHALLFFVAARRATW